LTVGIHFHPGLAAIGKNNISTGPRISAVQQRGGPGAKYPRVAHDPLLYYLLQAAFRTLGSTACREGGRIYVCDSDPSIEERPESQGLLRSPCDKIGSDHELDRTLLSTEIELATKSHYDYKRLCWSKTRGELGIMASNGKLKSQTDEAAGVPRIDASTLLASAREIILIHKDNQYRLRITSNDKLILTK
jgi:hemin uptake protein HemP